MIPIKIECGCGQRYSFDVEPVGGRMPHTVACPACGTDGTGVANGVIACQYPVTSDTTTIVLPIRAQPIKVAARPMMATATAVATPPHSGRPGALQGDRHKTETEARSKILWGDPSEEVVKFAMMQGLPRDAALELVSSLVQERIKMLRGIGTPKIFIGIGLMCVPLLAYVAFERVGYLPLKLFAVTVMVGLYGLYLFAKGCFMVFLPKMESGDVADK